VLIGTFEALGARMKELDAEIGSTVIRHVGGGAAMSCRS
jgi:hypothetical protein